MRLVRTVPQARRVTRNAEIRVQAVPPRGYGRRGARHCGNGVVGKFASEKEAAKWILAHPRLTMPAKENHDNATEGVQTPLAPR